MKFQITCCLIPCVSILKMLVTCSITKVTFTYQCSCKRVLTYDNICFSALSKTSTVRITKILRQANITDRFQLYFSSYLGFQVATFLSTKNIRKSFYSGYFCGIKVFILLRTSVDLKTDRKTL